MLIDTGADTTLLPSDVVEKIGVKIEENTGFEVQVFDGDSKFLKMAKLDLLVFDKTFKGEFLVIDRPIGILGRNILNHLRLFFDGPGKEWEEQKR